MPRPVPTSHDATARRFLDAAAQLIDAMFVESVEDRPRRLRSIRFPAALEWIRIEDVVELAREASGGTGVSRKAFHARWKTKDDFIRDAVQHTVLSRDDPALDPTSFADRLLETAAPTTLSETIVKVADSMLAFLLTTPRSFLAMHIGPTLDQHTELRQAVVDAYTEHPGDQLWFRGYAHLLEQYGLRLRPGWTLERVHEALMAMLDGALLRTRLDREKMTLCEWKNASMLSEMIMAFTLGVVDIDSTGQVTREALDAVVERERWSRSDG